MTLTGTIFFFNMFLKIIEWLFKNKSLWIKMEKLILEFKFINHASLLNIDLNIMVRLFNFRINYFNPWEFWIHKNWLFPKWEKGCHNSNNSQKKSKPTIPTKNHRYNSNLILMPEMPNLYRSTTESIYRLVSNLRELFKNWNNFWYKFLQN